MSGHFLYHFFHAQSIALFGASVVSQHVGTLVFHNLLQGFRGKLFPINPKYQEVQGIICYPRLEEITEAIDLAIIATPASTVPEIVASCGKKGVRAIIILSAGFAESGSEGRELQEKVLTIAKQHQLRLIGPNCLGIMRPSQGLNATFSKNNAKAGSIALVSQSGALCTAILDWAESRNIGFSAVASLGDVADVDFGDVLDFLALDSHTKSILLYIEGIRDARGFLSGLRAAARMKPVIVVKSGRHAAGSRAALSHTGALIGSDDVFNAALERAGAIRAETVEQMFAATEILSGNRKVQGNRLVIITNGGGPGVIAADRASELGIDLVELSQASRTQLDHFLPAHWSHGNPVDILGDAPPERYREALLTCLYDENVDGVLIILTPQAMTEPTEVAKAVLFASQQSQKPILACWMGDSLMKEAWRLFAEHHIPYFHSPEAAVEAFAYLADYQRNQKQLLETPDAVSKVNAPNLEQAQAIIQGVFKEKRFSLTGSESKALLSCFHIPVMESRKASNVNEAIYVAESIGFPVAMKIDSADITHKSDVGGVRLDLNNSESVAVAFHEMLWEVQKRVPQAKISGVTIERMVKRPHQREVLIGLLHDPVFGPVITFGAGGTTVEVLKDRAVELPPLNTKLIQRMIRRTKIAKMLENFRNLPAIHWSSLEKTLSRISEISCLLPEIKELDINPMLVDEYGAIAVDARIILHRSPQEKSLRYCHMAIHPYPKEWSSEEVMNDGQSFFLRPIHPEDAILTKKFLSSLSAESKYYRYMEVLREITPTMLQRLTQIDYDREMVLIGILPPDNTPIALGHYYIESDGESAEFALVVADAYQGKGIGQILMERLLTIAKTRGLKQLSGEVSSDNHKMRQFLEKLGFSIKDDSENHRFTASKLL
jgi:acetyltransferase